MSKRLSRISSDGYFPLREYEDYAGYQREIASQVKEIQHCSDEKLLTNIASCGKNKIEVRLAACERIDNPKNLEYLLWQAGLGGPDNCKVTVAVAKKIKKPCPILNAALRPVLFFDGFTALYETIKDAIALVTNVSLLEEFISLAKARRAYTFELLAYERAVELLVL